MHIDLIRSLFSNIVIYEYTVDVIYSLIIYATQCEPPNEIYIFINKCIPTHLYGSIQELEELCKIILHNYDVHIINSNTKYPRVDILIGHNVLLDSSHNTFIINDELTIYENIYKPSIDSKLMIYCRNLDSDTYSYITDEDIMLYIISRWS